MPSDGKNLNPEFDEFIKTSVSTKSAETDRAKERWHEVADHLKAKLGEKFAGAFLSGSYARRVQVRTLKDVDIIIELIDDDGAFEADARATLGHIKALLSDFPNLLHSPEARVRAVTLHFDDVDFTIDVVPAIPQPNERHLLAANKPEESLNTWTLESPRPQLEAAHVKNVLLDGHYTRATKLVKEWNQGFSDDKAMPSYLAESILHLSVDHWDGYEACMTSFFRAALNKLSAPGPNVPCPGDPSRFVDEMLKPERRARALELVRNSLVDAEAAEAEPAEDSSLNKWAKVFSSPDFPAPKNDPAKFAGALRLGEITASGASIRTGSSGRRIAQGRSWRER